MRYCSECGARVSLRIPEGDNRPRHVCDACATVHYSNPRIVAGCIVTCDDRILICKRAIEPRSGYWTLPAGFMEHDETVLEAAAREAYEEACVAVELDALYAVVDVVHAGQVHMMYRGRMKNASHSAGPESTETRLVTIQEIPWPELAFRSVTFTLECFRNDLEKGEFGLHSTVFDCRG